jgi:hypothetical protein
MPALDPETRERWREMVVVDRDAATVGTIASFYLDQASGLPIWALVRAGWLGDRHSFVPLADRHGAVAEPPRTDPEGSAEPEPSPGSCARSRSSWRRPRRASCLRRKGPSGPGGRL